MSDNQHLDISQDRSSLSDIVSNDWVNIYVPLFIRPYIRLMRIDRPIGIWLLLFPCWWSVVLAPQQGGWPNSKLLLLMAVGAIIMRSAGCIINDIWDRRIDARVARTASRPLASGAISLRRAMIFLITLLCLGFLILISLNQTAIMWGAAVIIPVILYPAMKRVTYWPQAFLGITFNWGALLGWVAVNGTANLPAFLLYIGSVAWTLHYDTIYAHQDKHDDIIIGVKSTAIKFGDSTKLVLVLFSFIAIVAWSSVVFFTHIGWPGYMAVISIAIHLAWQIIAVDLNNPKDCLAKFRSNQWIGWILLIGFFVGQIAQLRSITG